MAHNEMTTAKERKLASEIIRDLREDLSTVDEQRLAKLVRVQNVKRLRHMAKGLRGLDVTTLDGLMFKVEIRLLLKHESCDVRIQNAVAAILRSSTDQRNAATLDAVKRFTGINDAADDIAVTCCQIMLANVALASYD